MPHTAAFIACVNLPCASLDGPLKIHKNSTTNTKDGTNKNSAINAHKKITDGVEDRTVYKHKLYFRRMLNNVYAAVNRKYRGLVFYYSCIIFPFGLQLSDLIFPQDFF